MPDHCKEPFNFRGVNLFSSSLCLKAYLPSLHRSTSGKVGGTWLYIRPSLQEQRGPTPDPVDRDLLGDLFTRAPPSTLASWKNPRSWPANFANPNWRLTVFRSLASQHFLTVNGCDGYWEKMLACGLSATQDKINTSPLRGVVRPVNLAD